MDKFDKAILAALQQQGRMSNQELADAIGLSPSPCLRRLRALEEAGFIDGYGAPERPQIRPYPHSVYSNKPG